jgi:methionyl-tRNA formyltransferase
VRTVFLGSSGFAVVVLSALSTSPHRPELVVTPPDRPKGRGRKTAPPPAAVAARDLGIPLLQAASVNDPGAAAAISGCASSGSSSASRSSRTT